MLAGTRYILTPRRITTSFCSQALSLSTMPQTRSLAARSTARSARLSHQERTSSEPRNDSLQTVLLKNVTPVNDRIRTYRLEIENQGSFNVPSNLLAMTPFTR